MSVFVFFVDAEGYACGGTCDTSSRSSETWRMKDIPIVPLDPADIAWPEGERWAHLTTEYAPLAEPAKEAA